MNPNSKDAQNELLLEKIEMMQAQMESLQKKVQPKNKDKAPAPDGGPNQESPIEPTCYDTCAVEMFAEDGTQFRKVIREDKYDPEIHLLIERIPARGPRGGARKPSAPAARKAPTSSLAEQASKPAPKKAPKKTEE